MRTGFLIDMDGVIYKGSELIPGADIFIKRLLELDAPFMFLTNNSSRTRRDIATKIKRMGIPIEERHVFTCAMATARFLARQKPHGSAYVIGEGGLLGALHINGFSIVDSAPDYVVVGEGTSFTAQSIETAVQLVLQGAKLISTNPDPNCPTPRGLRPGCGAIAAMIEKASGVKAFSLGKPSPIMMREAMKELELLPEETIMVGDTMDTDILGGLHMGFRTALTLSGSTKRADLAHFAFAPDYIVETVADIPLDKLFAREEEPAMA